MGKDGGGTKSKGKVGGGGAMVNPSSSPVQTPPAQTPPASNFMTGYNGATYKTFPSYAAAIAYHEPLGQKFVGNLSGPQRAAVIEYTGSGYQWMNDELRFNLEQSPTTKNLKRALNKPEAVVQENIVVRRTFSWGGMAKLKEGDTFTDKGFTSTSADPSMVWGGYKYSVLVPKGAKGAFVRSISQHKSESEFLLQAGTKFRIVKKATYSAEGVLEVVVNG